MWGGPRAVVAISANGALEIRKVIGIFEMIDDT
jgi:hypothetical protein